MKATFNGVTLAESNAIETVEGNSYFPHDSVNWDYFRDSPRQYTCSWKGDARYYHITAEGEELANGAWEYPEPKPAARNIAGYVCFDRKVQVA